MSGVSGRGAPSDPAVVGRVVRPHGLKGDLVVEPADRTLAACRSGESFWVAGAWRTVDRGRLDNKGRWVIALEGVTDRDAAEALRDADLVIEADDLPELEDDRFYIHDLIGCRVEDPDGGYLGEVVGVVRGPQDQLEIAHRGARSLVPMARDLLHEIDVEGGRIVIDAPPGLENATRR